ncbi:MAG: alpha/beta hydrolase [Micropruina sp.]
MTRTGSTPPGRFATLTRYEDGSAMTRTVRPPRAARNTVTSADGTRIGYRTVGDGTGLILVGGALRTAEDYLPLAAALAERCAVHVVDRRGRGDSGPQDPDTACAPRSRTSSPSRRPPAPGGRSVIATEG